jgi:Arc/MetJ-type ribon-helix-helix transcriptional regulator
MQIALPPTLETLMQQQIAAGIYHDANELVGEAMLQFFEHRVHLSPQQISSLQQDLASRRARLENGEEQWVDGEMFMAAMAEKYTLS